MQKLKAKKFPIIENKALKGGLTNSIQRYSIFYLFPVFNEDNTIKYSPKISVEHYIEKEDTRTRPLSLRFSNEVFLKEFIMELIRSLAFYEKKLHKGMNTFSEPGQIFWKAKITDLLKEVNNNYKIILLEKS